MKSVKGRISIFNLHKFRSCFTEPASNAGSPPLTSQSVSTARLNPPHPLNQPAHFIQSYAPSRPYVQCVFAPPLTGEPNSDCEWSVAISDVIHKYIVTELNYRSAFHFILQKFRDWRSCWGWRDCFYSYQVQIGAPTVRAALSTKLRRHSTCQLAVLRS